VATFDHERLHVYDLAVDFLVVVENIVGTYPAGRAYLADQLRRASTSIVLNIAEGVGEFSKKDKARFYHMALRSATECAAVLDVSKRLSLATDSHVSKGREILLQVVAMMVTLVRRVGASGTGKGMGKGKGIESLSSRNEPRGA
jgi:four helix bundle protein